METPYDWITMAVFVGLIILFLERSTAPEPVDTIWHYIPPSVGCAFANYAGNEGYGWAAIAILIGVGAYVLLVLKLQIPGVGPPK
jgi:hypothetical protein